jgi:hypothetical protein
MSLSAFCFCKGKGGDGVEESKPTASEQQKTTESEDSKLSAWQTNLLPLMTYMIVGLAIFFFLASFVQLAYLHWSILGGSRADACEPLDVLSHDSLLTPEEVLSASRLQMLATLECFVLERRYHQANVSLMSSVWIRYLGFVTGMILALVGASFVLGKLREPPSKMGVGTAVARFSFEGTSPGIILAGLGVVLMLTTITVRHEFAVVDRPVYAGVDVSPAVLESSTVLEESSTAPELDSPESIYPDSED